jgi:formiminoglutamate deiminase
MNPARAQYFCEHAWLGGPTTEADVLVSVEGDRITGVHLGGGRPTGAVRLAGLTLPGFANAHSHAFHRALRGRSERGQGTFWTWRDQMYAVAEALTPENYYELARATYAEMALSGITAVGEFHYVHHQLGGLPYSAPNEMGLALVRAATEAGIRVTLIDACYLTGGPGRIAQGPQLRFSDVDAEAWAVRVAALTELSSQPGARLGAAVHSVRAVPPPGVTVVARFASDNALPLHFHLSEQRQENDASQASYGASPTDVLDAAGALGPLSTAVHATHLSASDAARLGRSGSGVCMCPTTEQDLADGIGPARRLADDGVAISLGSDSHATIDLFAEMRALEYDERLSSGRRGNWSAQELLVAATMGGHRAIGWPDAGSIAVGAVADLVTVSTESPRLAGVDADCLAEMAVFASCGADVVHVVSSGQVVVSGGHHCLVDDVPQALQSAIHAVVRP